MDITDIIIRPLVTEKSHSLREEKNPKVSFVVHMKANKQQIKMAFKAIFGLDAMDVNTLIRKPQPTRVTAKSRKNYNKAFKIAYIKISEANYKTLQETIDTTETKE